MICSSVPISWSFTRNNCLLQFHISSQRIIRKLIRNTRLLLLGVGAGTVITWSIGVGASWVCVTAVPKPPEPPRTVEVGCNELDIIWSDAKCEYYL